jgi:hypothetical protein
MSRSAGDNQDHITPVLRAMVTFLAIVFFFLLEAVLHHVNSKVSDITRTSPTEAGYFN